eukprot:713136-Pelagomonas_calceolata.AAC.1
MHGCANHICTPTIPTLAPPSTSSHHEPITCPGETPLTLACATNKPKVLSLLLSKGACVKR